MIKFYIEIFYSGYGYGNYVIQSKWFNSEKKAIEWANNIDFIHENYSVALMSSVWENGCCGDIKQERILKQV